MEEYLRSLQQQLKSFPAEERIAIMAELRSHAESAEADLRMGNDPEQRRSKLMKELGSPADMGKGFLALYRPNRFVDYLLVAIPYVLSRYVHDLYLLLQPQYPWMDIRLNVLFDLVMILVGLRRRSALITLFWIPLAVFEILYVVLQGVWQPYWYSYWDFGLQTVVGVILLLGVAALLGQIVWKNRHDALIVVFAVLPLGMELLGTAFGSIRPVSYIYNPLDRSLLVIFLTMLGGNAQLYGTLATIAVFFLASNRDVRWASLLASALIIGFGRVYLFDFERSTVALVAQWVYYLYVLVPLVAVGYTWYLDRCRRQQIQLVARHA